MEAYLLTSPALPGTDRAIGFHRAVRGHGVIMSRKNKGFTAVLPGAQSAEQTTAAPEQTTAAPEQTIAPVTEAVRRSLQVAREANASNPPVDPAAPARATLVRPAKGENPERRRVFGYDAGPGGKVPLAARVVVVNAGSLKTSYPGLAEAVETTPEASVADLKSAGVDSKSFRRAFRSGLIRFKLD